MTINEEHFVAVVVLVAGLMVELMWMLVKPKRIWRAVCAVERRCARALRGALRTGIL